MKIHVLSFAPLGMLYVALERPRVPGRIIGLVRAP